MNIKKTANLLLNFAIKRLAEIFGIMVFLVGSMLLTALISYSPDDPNFIFPDNTKIKNSLGFYGSFTSDLFTNPYYSTYKHFLISFYLLIFHFVSDLASYQRVLYALVHPIDLFHSLIQANYPTNFLAIIEAFFYIKHYHY